MQIKGAYASVLFFCGAMVAPVGRRAAGCHKTFHAEQIGSGDSLRTALDRTSMHAAARDLLAAEVMQLTEYSAYALAAYADLKLAPNVDGPNYIADGALHYNARASEAEQAAAICELVSRHCYPAPEESEMRERLRASLTYLCLLSLDSSGACVGGWHAPTPQR